jgi:hypothetical protein
MALRVALIAGYTGSVWRKPALFEAQSGLIDLVKNAAYTAWQPLGRCGLSV